MLPNTHTIVAFTSGHLYRVEVSPSAVKLMHTAQHSASCPCITGDSGV